MAAARRDRARKENTFFETVKASLEDLRAEIIAVKTSIDEFKLASWNSCYDDSSRNDWTTWFALGFENEVDTVKGKSQLSSNAD